MLSLSHKSLLHDHESSVPPELSCFCQSGSGPWAPRGETSEFSMMSCHRLGDSGSVGGSQLNIQSRPQSSCALGAWCAVPSQIHVQPATATLLAGMSRWMRRALHLCTRRCVWEWMFRSFFFFFFDTRESELKIPKPPTSLDSEARVSLFQSPRILGRDGTVELTLTETKLHLRFQALVY